MGQTDVLKSKSHRGETPDTTLVGSEKPVILYENDPTLLTSTIQIVVQTGSLDDPKGKTGLTALFCELMLRGTKKRSRASFQSELERMGAALYVRPSHDTTVFVGKVIKENTAQFLELLQDAFLNPAFSAKEFKDLQTETLAEIAHLKNSNNRLTGLALRREVYSGTALEKPVTGSLSTVKAISRQDVLDAYAKHFRRGALVFSAAAPLAQSEIEKHFQIIWKGLPKGNLLRQSDVSQNMPKKPTLVLIHKPNTSTGVVMFGQKGITAEEPDRYTLSVGNFSFGSEPLVSRLFRTIRGELGWTYYVGSTYHATGSLSRQPGFFAISSTPSVEFTTKTIRKTWEMWKSFMEEGLTKEELALAKESLINSYPFEFESAEKRLWQKLYGHLYGVPVLSPKEFEKTISEINNNKIISALEKHQTLNGWWIMVVADQSVFEKQLAEEQKDLPESERLTISKVVSPDELVQ